MTNTEKQQPASDWPQPNQFRRSIRVEFSLYVSGMILVIMLAAGFVITNRYVTTVTHGVIETLLVQARAFSGSAGKLLISGGNPDALLLNNICNKLAADNPSVYWAGIADQNNRFVAHTDLKQVMAGKSLNVEVGHEYAEMLQQGEALAMHADSIVITIPITENGLMLGHLGVVSSTDQIAKARQDSIVAVVSITLITVFVGLPLTMLGLRRKLQPVKLIADQLKSADFSDFNLSVPLTARNEFGYLAETLRVAGDKLRIAQNERIENERIAKELEIAREIQARILPREYPSGGAYACAGAYRSAKEVGGDYYDFIQYDNNKLAVLVADVSGKSLPGMLVMLMTRDIVRQTARTLQSPAEVLKEVNRQLRADIKKGMFVTMFFGVLDPASGELAFASAGHNPLVYFNSTGGATELIKTKGYPLGMMPSAQFDARLEEHRLKLTAGDWVVQYTDGVNEAHNDQQEEYGMERFMASLMAGRQLTPEQLIERTLDDHSGFVQSAPQYDDITLLAVKWTGQTVDTNSKSQSEAVNAR